MKRKSTLRFIKTCSRIVTKIWTRRKKKEVLLQPQIEAEAQLMAVAKLASL